MMALKFANIEAYICFFKQIYYLSIYELMDISPILAISNDVLMNISLYFYMFVYFRFFCVYT